MIDDKDLVARTILKIWNNSFLIDVQNFEFTDKLYWEKLGENLASFKDLKVNSDWYDSGFFKFKPIYTLEVRKV